MNDFDLMMFGEFVGIWIFISVIIGLLCVFSYENLYVFYMFMLWNGSGVVMLIFVCLVVCGIGNSKVGL